MRCDMLFNTALSLLLAARLAQAGPVYEFSLFVFLSLEAASSILTHLVMNRPKVVRAESSTPESSAIPPGPEYVTFLTQKDEEMDSNLKK